MHSAVDLTVSQAKTYGIVGVVGLVVVGLLLSMIVAKVVGKLIVLAVFIAGGAFLYSQRAQIEDKVKHCDTTVMGVHIKLSAAQLQACQNLSKNITNGGVVTK